MKPKHKRLLASVLIVIVVGSLFMLWLSPQPASSTDPPQTIESDATEVTQTGTWTAQRSGRASGRSYMYSSGSADDTLSLDFYGTGIEVVFVKHRSFGAFTVEIDNNEARTVTATNRNTRFNQRAVFEYLDEGPHTIRIMGIDGVVGIDAFIVSQSQVAMPTLTPLPYHSVPAESATTPAEDSDASSSQSQSISISACDVETTISNVEGLRNAVAVANNDPDVNTTHCIFLEPSTYNLVLTSGQDGTLLIDHNINFYGLDYPANVILDGEDLERIMYINNGQVEIHHLHLTNGVHEGSANAYGGAIRMNNGQLYVTDSIFSSSGDMNVTQGGGAILGGGTFVRTQFIGNEAGGGGAIQNVGELTIVDSCFIDNHATWGGAILNDLNIDTITIHRSKFEDNQGLGSAIYNSETLPINAQFNYWASGQTIAGNVDTANPLAEYPVWFDPDPVDPENPLEFVDCLPQPPVCQSGPLESTCQQVLSRVYVAVADDVGQLDPTHPAIGIVENSVNTTSIVLRQNFLASLNMTPEDTFNTVMFALDNTVMGFIFVEDPTALADWADSEGNGNNALVLPLQGNTTASPGTRHGYELVCPYFLYWGEGAPSLGSQFPHEHVPGSIVSLIGKTQYDNLQHEALVVCDKAKAEEQFYMGIYSSTPTTPNPSETRVVTRFSEYTPTFFFGQVFTQRTGGFNLNDPNTFAGMINEPGHMYNGDSHSMRELEGWPLVDNTVTLVMGSTDDARICPQAQGIDFVSENDPHTTGCSTDWSTWDQTESWERGERGWGSPMWNGEWNTFLSAACPFQQDPLSVYDVRDPANAAWRIAEIRAAAADMFLNWVYDSTGSDVWKDIRWGNYWEYIQGNVPFRFCNSLFLTTEEERTDQDEPIPLPGQARRVWMREVVMVELTCHFTSEDCN